MRRRLAVCCALGVLVSGCASPSEQAARICEGWGYGVGSAAFLGCVGQEAQVVQENREMWAGTTAGGAALMAPAPHVYVVPAW